MTLKTPTLASHSVTSGVNTLLADCLACQSTQRHCRCSWSSRGGRWRAFIRFSQTAQRASRENRRSSHKVEEKCNGSSSAVWPCCTTQTGTRHRRRLDPARGPHATIVDNVVLVKFRYLLRFRNNLPAVKSREIIATAEPNITGHFHLQDPEKACTVSCETSNNDHNCAVGLGQPTDTTH